MSFGQREVQQRHEPCLLPQRRAGLCYGGWHELDQVLIAPGVEVAEEAVAPIVLPADEVNRVYRQGLPGWFAMSDPTVIAVNQKAQRLDVLWSPGGPLSTTLPPFEAACKGVEPLCKLSASQLFSRSVIEKADWLKCWPLSWP